MMALEMQNLPDICRQASLVLLPLADPARAPAMKAYMKQRHDFLGIATPARRLALKPLLATLKTADADVLLAAAAQLWAMPEREFQYAAIDILAKFSRKLEPNHVPAMLELAQQKSWWDTVDGLAGVIGDILYRRRHSQEMEELVEAALTHPNLWVRRIAMLHQLGWKSDTDAVRLFRFATTLAPERDFFIRKAVGWALRDYSWHQPQAVREFVERMAENLSPLSRREALRAMRAP
jgi:3-methyladenine DNA glycosylase AlkD